MEKFGGKGGRAGLPQEVIMKDYPKCQHVSGDLDDTMKNIDEINNKSVGKARKHVSHQK